MGLDTPSQGLAEDKRKLDAGSEEGIVRASSRPEDKEEVVRNKRQVTDGYGRWVSASICECE